MSQKHPQLNKKFSRKPSTQSSDHSDSSSDSQQTYLEQSQEIKKQYTLHDVKFEDSWTLPSHQNSQSDEEASKQDLTRPFKEQMSRTPNKKVFPSISRDYNEQIKQKITVKGKLSLTNLQIKTLQQNQKIRQWKCQLYQKIFFRQAHYTKKNLSKKWFLQCFEKMTSSDAKNSKRQQKQIKAFICSCHHVFSSKNTLRTHQQETRHSTRLMIDSLVYRKELTRHYNLFGDQLKIQSFDSQLLYKNFQVLFLDAEIHTFQFINSKNQPFISSLLNLKDFTIFFVDSYDQEVERWFKTQWMEIYKILHEYHKGNQFLCHKCLSIPQHICLFALGLNFLLTKRKNISFSSIDEKNFASILKLVQLVLKDCVEKPKKKQVKIKAADSKAISKFLGNLRDLLFRYLDTFDYIDLGESEVMKKLNDDLF